VGDEGQLFESVTAQKISERLKEMGFDIKKSQLELESPIKEVGEFPVKVKFEHNLEAEIRVIIAEEKE
jgi:large subunit ribosomal protein L9